jgi:16S rRNA (guanine527-N7)-methyltransferase
VTAVDPFGAIPAGRARLVEAFVEALERANRGVNLVSRASSDTIRAGHVAHSLALAHRRFRAGTTVVDWGTGGGLPAVPLAICFPEVEFVAVDSIGKKARALEGIVRETGLDNVTVWLGRAESWDGAAEYAVSRATAPLDRLWAWSRRVLRPVRPDAGEWAGGLLCLKGGDLNPERRDLERLDPSVRLETVDLARTFGRPEWADKYIVHVTPDRGVRP